MEKLFLVIGSGAGRTLSAAEKLCRLSEKYGVTVLTKEQNREYFSGMSLENIQYTDGNGSDLKECGCVLTVGGDGTLLRGAKTAYTLNCPVAGINTGRIGFLAKIPEECPEDVIRRILDSQYTIKYLMTLRADWNDRFADGILNDITLIRKPGDRMNTFHVYCDDEEVASWRADGVVVFTPAGSTAYAYAAGGPAVDLETRMIGVIPICTQSGRGNALICNGRRRIGIRNHGNNLDIRADGSQTGTLEKGAELVITQGMNDVHIYEIDNQWKIADLNRTLANMS